MSCAAHAHDFPTHAGKTIASVDALDPATDAALLDAHLRRDGAVLVRNLVSADLCQRLRADLKPHFDADQVDGLGFFPPTTKRAFSILSHSDACAELVVNPLFQATARRVLESHYTYWEGQEKRSVIGAPQVASIVGFRVEPGGKQQALHRDDADYHTRNCDMPAMLGCVTALTRTTRENGATVVIPQSHLWGPDRCPLDEEAIPGELGVGDAMVFYGNVYHAGGGNVTVDEARETVGVFMCRGTLRQEENQFLELPPDVAKARGFSPELLRLLGYGICRPALGLYRYKDPMEEVFGVVDEHTVVR